MELNKIYNLNCLDGLKQLPDQSIDCCVTSPPYFGLRDYGVDGQVGLEKSADEYVKRLVEIFSEVKRALKDDGTFWLNIGDSYMPHNGTRGNTNSKGGRYIAWRRK